ncbi:MAG TPA: peptidylprolyl isomerase [Bacteroidota bacterium]|nr:peptidylprolyl isomerase [Bacteroidota bacterium]
MKLRHVQHVILITVLLLAAGCAPKASDTLVLQVGPKKINLDEYENFYTRNSPGWDAAQKSTYPEREHFLDLLTNYELKLQDAYDRHLNDDSDIVGELKDYRRSLAKSYLIEKEVTSPGIRELYQRRTEEVRAQHILLRLAPDAKPDDTLRVYNKALDIIHQAIAGTNFDSLALRYSEDPSVKQNKGDVYYFTGGEMAPQFEDAAFALKKGEITAKPIRSPFGYHIIKITDREPSRGSIKVSHIMARFHSPTPDSSDLAGALLRIKGAQDSLKKGWDFHKLAAKLSEDVGSVAQQGSLGWFERRHFVQPFDEAAFQLHAGEVSPIVRTPFGFHLLRCDSAKPLLPFNDPQMQEELKKTYQQIRFQDDYNAFIARLKKQYNYAINPGLFTTFVGELDSTKTTDDSAWAAKVPEDQRRMPILLTDRSSMTLDTVLALFSTDQEYKATPLKRSDLTDRLNKMAEPMLIDIYSTGLEDRDPKFRELMKEYAEGIILYKAEQSEVWGKTSVTDSILHQFYTAHPDSFMLPQMINISVLVFDSDTLAYTIYDSLKHGSDFNSFVTQYREDQNSKTEDGSRGLEPVSTDDLTRHADSLAIGEVGEPVPLESGSYAIVKVIAKQPSRPKTFEEAGAEVSNAYQEWASKKLEDEWVSRIKERYPVVQYKDALKDAFRSPPSAP